MIGREMAFNRQSILLIPFKVNEKLLFNAGIQLAVKSICLWQHKLHNATANVAIEANNVKPFTVFSSFKKKESKPATTGISMSNKETIFSFNYEL